MIISFYIVLNHRIKLTQQPNVAGLLQVVKSVSRIDLKSRFYNFAAGEPEQHQAWQKKKTSQAK